MSDSDNFGSDLESDSLGSHLGASDEEVDECNVNAVRMQPTPAHVAGVSQENEEKAQDPFQRSPMTLCRVKFRSVISNVQS